MNLRCSSVIALEAARNKDVIRLYKNTWQDLKTIFRNRFVVAIDPLEFAPTSSCLGQIFWGSMDPDQIPAVDKRFIAQLLPLVEVLKIYFRGAVEGIETVPKAKPCWWATTTPAPCSWSLTS